MTTDTTLTPAEVRRILLNDSPEPEVFATGECYFQMYLELVLSRDMKPLEWGRYYSAAKDLTTAIEKNSREGNHTIFVPLRINLPDLPENLHFHRLTAEADVEVTQYSYQLVTPPAPTVPKPRTHKPKAVKS